MCWDNDTDFMENNTLTEYEREWLRNYIKPCSLAEIEYIKKVDIKQYRTTRVGVVENKKGTSIIKVRYEEHILSNGVVALVGTTYTNEFETDKYFVWMKDGKEYNPEELSL